MTRNSAMIKLGLGIAVTVFALDPASAARKSFHALALRPIIYYRSAPAQIYNRVPFGYTASQNGLYDNHALPDGTITGPLAPESNGG
jgi:hypothetical protein